MSSRRSMFLPGPRYNELKTGNHSTESNTIRLDSIQINMIHHLGMGFVPYLKA